MLMYINDTYSFGRQCISCAIFKFQIVLCLLISASLQACCDCISGPNMTPVDFFYVKVNSYLPSPAFSPTSCCLASVWHDRKSDTCTLRIAQIPSVTANGSPPLERHLADR